jgi:predicted metal-dependent HD superfamily phosphohydrolase
MSDASAEFGAIEIAHWSQAWEAQSLAVPAGLLDALLARYAEPQRAYHTRQHLRECFEHLEPARSLAHALPEVQLALWFHDAIYDPRARDNEERSAQWAADSLAGAGAAPETADRVRALVLATRHAAAPEAADARLLVDVDLSILGAPPARFDEYERQIRIEYAWVPEPAFVQARANVLRGFLARPSIFNTPWFAARLEAPARANLEQSLAALW